MPRKHFEWKIRDKALQLGERTLILGVLNVTPDSFSDGGKYLDPDRAFARAVELEEEGADVIDIGAESTRPGSLRISEAEELHRLVPVLKRLRNKLTVPISVDVMNCCSCLSPVCKMWIALLVLLEDSISPSGSGPECLNSDRIFSNGGGPPLPTPMPPPTPTSPVFPCSRGPQVLGSGISRYHASSTVSLGSIPNSGDAVCFVVVM